MAERRRGSLVAVALVTCVALWLIWAAFHDIAHREADLTAEYTILAAGAVWLGCVAVGLLRAGQRVLGAVSLAALAIGAWGQASGISAVDEPGPTPGDLATGGAYLWFLLLTGILVVASLRAPRTNRPPA